MRDLRGKRVFPRILYLLALHELDRVMHGLFKLFVGQPTALFGQLLDEIEARKGVIAITLSAGAVLAALIRAYALLCLAIAVLLLALSQT